VEFERLPEGVKVTAISAGGDAAYALLSNGKVMAWGDNARGQLGTRSVRVTGAVNEKMSVVPVEVEALSEVESVSGGNTFAWALRKGEVYGWGGNGAGQLSGTSTESCSSNPCARTPQRVGLESVSAISAGRSFGLALRGGKLYGLGANSTGQLGDGTTEGPVRTPMEVKGLEDVGGMVAGEQHSLAFLQSGPGPAPLLTLTSEPEALKIVWRFSAPKGEYHIRWISAEAGETAEEYEQEAEADRQRAAEVEGITEEERKHKEELETQAKELEEKAKKIKNKYEPSPDLYKGECSQASPCEYLTSEGRTGTGEIKAHKLKPEGYVVQVNEGAKVRFIHGLVLAAEGAPVNTASPTIAGTPQQGQPVVEQHGSWTNEPTSYEYQWRRCWPAYEKCTLIAGATAQTYVPTSEDVGHVLTVTEAASNAKGPSDPAVSSRSAVVPPPPPPANTSPPTITGTAQQGQPLTEHHGAWANEPSSYAYRWLQCNALGEGCSAVLGATSSTYTPVMADVGHAIRVEETATNSGGSGAAISAATAPVLPAVP
jgi:hypothetical protein